MLHGARLRSGVEDHARKVANEGRADFARPASAFKAHHDDRNAANSQWNHAGEESVAVVSRKLFEHLKRSLLLCLHQMGLGDALHLLTRRNAVELLLVLGRWHRTHLSVYSGHHLREERRPRTWPQGLNVF
jgi:hypothetical protein